MGKGFLKSPPCVEKGVGDRTEQGTGRADFMNWRIMKQRNHTYCVLCMTCIQDIDFWLLLKYN